MVPEVIRTERLLLRPWRMRDLPQLAAYVRDPEWTRFLPVSHAYTEADAERYLAGQLLLEAERGQAWALQLADSAVGGIDLTWVCDGRGAELGYSLARAHWRTGLATEAARAVLDAAFRAHRELERIAASAIPDNLGSLRVLEKIGMRRDGVLRKAALVRGELFDQVWYSILRQEWAKGSADPQRPS